MLAYSMSTSIIVIVGICFILVIGATTYITHYVTRISGRLENINTVNALKAKLYDSDIIHRKNFSAIRSLKNDLAVCKKRLVVAVSANEKKVTYIEALRKQLIKLFKVFRLVSKNYKTLKLSYENIKQQNKSLRLELAAVNERFKEAQRAVSHYRERIMHQKKTKMGLKSAGEMRHI
jgi:Mg2+ and Co2+ transporter CorA